MTPGQHSASWEKQAHSMVTRGLICKMSGAPGSPPCAEGPSAAVVLREKAHRSDMGDGEAGGVPQGLRKRVSSG